MRFRLSCLLLLLIGAGAAALALPSASTHRPTVLAAIRFPFTSSSSPAIADANGDGRPEFAVTSDNIGDITRQRNDPLNVNEVAVFGWREGSVRLLPGWPRHTRDATLGLAMADLNGDGRAEILGACGQDTPPPTMRATGTWLVSRLYVWKSDGTPLAPWYPVNESTWNGLAFGHAYAAPLINDLNRDGRLEVLHASQGVWEDGGFRHGSLRLYSSNGALLARTQSDFPSLPWYTLNGFAMDTPAVIADLNGDGRNEVVAATYDGHLYAWTAAGSPVNGWFPSGKAGTETPQGVLIRGGIATADIDGDGRDEVIAAGYDGALYCWGGNGRLRWRTACGKSPLTSGVALGRLRRNSDEVDAVVGDAAGTVSVCGPDGAIRWRFTTTSSNGIYAEPAIGDVNGDGTQDMVVGGTDGYVYALDGETGKLLWQVATFPAPTQEGMRLQSIFGAPALCDLRGNGHMNIVVATGQRYIADLPAHLWKGYGHAIVLDCGPRTYNAARLDWPQYRQNACRTGHLSISSAKRLTGPGG